MKKTNKIWLVLAIALIVGGGILFVGSIYSLDFDLTKLSTQTYETNVYEISDDFENITIDVSATEVVFAPSDDGTCKVTCIDEEKLKHTAIVGDGTLKISVTDTRKWYDHIGVFFERKELTVYLPKEEYKLLSVTTSTGNVEIPEQFVFENITITGSTADVKCAAQVVDSVQMKTSTGNITLSGVDCKKIMIKTSTGYVCFEGCDADNISVKTSTGNVTGTLLSEKIFVTETSTGNVRVPKSTTGGTCEITTSTGNIEIEIRQKLRG